MMIRWWKHSEKGVTDKRTDKQTDRQIDVCTQAAFFQKGAKGTAPVPYAHAWSLLPSFHVSHCIFRENIMWGISTFDMPQWTNFLGNFYPRPLAFGHTHNWTTWSAILPWTPELAGLVHTHSDMAACWYINFILANIGHKNSIPIWNQCPFLWNILIWEYFISFITFSSFQKLRLS